MGLIPGPGTSTSLGCGQKQKTNKQKKHGPAFTIHLLHQPIGTDIYNYWPISETLFFSKTTPPYLVTPPRLPPLVCFGAMVIPYEIQGKMGLPDLL